MLLLFPYRMHTLFSNKTVNELSILLIWTKENSQNKWEYSSKLKQMDEYLGKFNKLYLNFEKKCGIPNPGENYEGKIGSLFKKHLNKKSAEKHELLKVWSHKDRRFGKNLKKSF